MTKKKVSGTKIQRTQGYNKGGKSSGKGEKGTPSCLLRAKKGSEKNRGQEREVPDGKEAILVLQKGNSGTSINAAERDE